MGAEPAWLTLALTLPEADEAWLAAFSDSLFMQLNYYDMQLIGGDTTRGPLSMTPVFTVLSRRTRSEAFRCEAGDWIYVTGTPATAPQDWPFCRIVWWWSQRLTPTTCWRAICARCRACYKDRRCAIWPVRPSICPTVLSPIWGTF